jgi:hypothetical protein
MMILRLLEDCCPSSPEDSVRIAVKISAQVLWFRIVLAHTQNTEFYLQAKVSASKFQCASTHFVREKKAILRERTLVARISP